MKMRKSAVKKILVCSLFLAVVVITSLWAAVNYLFIPKVVIPKVQEYIAANMDGPVKLTVKDISFHPARGFLLHDVKLCGPVILNEDHILRVKLVDIDLALMPLLWRHTVIKRFVMYGADLNIGRDAKGQWNFKPLLDLDVIKEMMAENNPFVIKEFRIKGGQIDYTDYFKKDNTLERRLTDVNLWLTNPKGQTYKLVVRAGAADRREEDAMLEITYEWKRNYIDGIAALHTEYLSEYWDYYLDDIFKPWHLKAQNINAHIQFSYLDKRFIMKGQYAVDGGALTYGDLSFRGNASINQDLKHVKSVPVESITTTKVSLSGLSLLTGQNIFLDKGNCKATITEKEIGIEDLSGEIKGRPICLSGRFILSEPHELHLTGKTDKVDNTFYLKILADNQCVADWEGKVKDSYAKLHADMPDLRNLAFNALTVQADIQFSDINELIGGMEDFKGGMEISGNIKGELDRPTSLNGEAVIKIEDLALRKSATTSFEFDVSARDGLFIGTIPQTNFCAGTFTGEMKATVDKIGVELNINKFDISKLIGSKELEGTKGIINGNIAFVANLADLSKAVGGGYIKATDCDFKKVPLFLATQEGIVSVTKNADFQMPVFKKVEGNYEIKDGGIDLNNISCSAAGLSLTISGRFAFSGEANFTAGAQFLGSHLFKTARQILIPETIGLDLITDGIVVKIKGQWPDWKQTTTVEPIRSLTSLIPSVGRGSPDKYTLKKLWP